mmetsp:Transcript_19215/g.46143  ORF Transcript_19215/g.46143 Transcript_19215/m.46143 type:complete len:223 (+) Transcript_19215:849-1517(+)
MTPWTTTQFSFVWSQISWRLNTVSSLQSSNGTNPNTPTKKTEQLTMMQNSATFSRHACLASLLAALAALAVHSDAFLVSTPGGRRATPSADASRLVPPVLLVMENGDDDDDDATTASQISPLEDGAYAHGPFGENLTLVALGSIALVMVAALVDLATDPRAELDVDLYLSITRSLGGGGLGGGGAEGTLAGGETAAQLPFLGSSEQIVGAFFGAPHQEIEFR